MVEITGIRHAWPEPAGFKILRPQGHEDHTFLHFLNEVHMKINGQALTLPPNSFLFFRSGTPQEFESLLPLAHDWFHFRGDLSALLKESGLEADRVYMGRGGAFITQIVKEMETEFFWNKDHREALMDLKLRELLYRLGRAVGGQESEEVELAAVAKFKRLRRRVFSSLNERWTVARMADAVGYSPSRFNAIYHTIYGISPTADLIEARIDRAKNLLLLPDLSVERIGEWLGYQNTTHFIRQFKSRVGVSPSVYRKNHLKNEVLK